MQAQVNGVVLVAAAAGASGVGDGDQEVALPQAALLGRLQGDLEVGRGVDPFAVELAGAEALVGQDARPGLDGELVAVFLGGGGVGLVAHDEGDLAAFAGRDRDVGGGLGGGPGRGEVKAADAFGVTGR